jgi:hypothetical protein
MGYAPPLHAVRLLVHGGVVAGGGVIGQPPLPFESILKESAMEIDAVRLVTPVLHDLQPVAGQHVADDLPQLVISLAEVQPGQEGNWPWPQIGPDEAPHLLHLISRYAYSILKGAVRRRQRLLQASPRVVKEPAMVGTPQPYLFWNAEGHVHGPVWAARLNQPQVPTAVAEEHQVLP